MKKKVFLRLILPTPLWQTFDYLPPESCDLSTLTVGVRIKVPFGKREVIGILLEISHHSDIAATKLKPALEVIDQIPILPPSLLKLYQWASDYYHYPIGEIVFGTLPNALRKNKLVNFPSPASFSFACPSSSSFVLNSHQQAAIETINQAHDFQTFLLAGITGSGKTEVYLQCLENKLKEGKQALILVPEIALTPQTVARFRHRFTDIPVVVLHSGLTDKNRFQTWWQARTGEAAIIIGTRSAIFIPLLNPGIIILDEEHDQSFKQHSGFRYSARDLAIIRGKIENIPVILGSATPSLESLYNAKRQRYHYLELPERAGEAKLPQLKIINLCGEKLQGGLSNPLIKVIQEHLAANGQVLIFLNRRGYAPILLCHQCGWMMQCRHCDARLALHHKPAHLQCHHCGISVTPPKFCEKCQQASLITLGLGTEQIELSLQNLFPNFPIIRVDRDSTRGKGKLDQLLNQIHQGEASILIGTQMLAKGHHLPNLSLVAIVDMDSGLFSTDFRATERMGQLLMQVAGRAGRELVEGQVYIQTHHPEHPLLTQLLHQGYLNFAESIFSEREAAQFPPFSYMALLRSEAVKQEDNLSYLTEVKNWIHKQNPPHLTLWGPIPAVMERKAGRYRAQLLLQAKSRNSLQNLLKPLARTLNQYKLSNKVRWSLDVDPQEI